MMCPYCEKEMIKGYVQSSRKIFWSQEKRRIFITPNRVKGDIPITSGFTIYHKESLFCNSCQIIIMKKIDK